MAKSRTERNQPTAVSGEIKRNAIEEVAAENIRISDAPTAKPKALELGRAKHVKEYRYVEELARLQLELVKLQEWVRVQGLRVVVIFEGRDAAGKGGVIKRIVECLNPRICRVVALGVPSERERTQWYFQRYIAHLPAAGELVLFDRSWYNRAGVEHVMGFCTDTDYREFLRSVPQFEHLLVRSGIILLKYWFSVSDEEQERRFQERMRNPIKRWKLSPMDLESRKHWVEYSMAKDRMLAKTDTKSAPWFVVDADNKKTARLNCIAHILKSVPYQTLGPTQLDLPARQPNNGYKRPPKRSQRFVPKVYT
jgi:polyphosphate kinase 2